MKETRRFPGLAKEIVERQLTAGLPASTADACERCGCTDERACAGDCSWIREGPCSACATPEELAEAGLEFAF